MVPRILCRGPKGHTPGPFGIYILRYITVSLQLWMTGALIWIHVLGCSKSSFEMTCNSSPCWWQTNFKVKHLDEKMWLLSVQSICMKLVISAVERKASCLLFSRCVEELETCSFLTFSPTCCDTNRLTVTWCIVNDTSGTKENQGKWLSTKKSSRLL